MSAEVSVLISYFISLQFALRGQLGDVLSLYE